MRLLFPLLASKKILWILLIINMLGTIYGYYWYGGQLSITPTQFIPFVPDSPTASLFFVFVLIAFLLGRNWPLFEALAIVTLFKYGIWAVVMNILTRTVSGYLPWEGYMLIISHGAMAIEGILYAPFYRIKLPYLAIAAIWVLHDVIIDYVFMQFPHYPDLYMYIREIGYFTFWLSIFSIAIAYYLCIRKNRLELSIKY